MKRAAASASNGAALIPREEVASSGYDPPKIIDRDVVATRHASDDFGEQLAARAWHLGLFAAKRKAFIGDGSSWIWTTWDRHFKAFGFVPILDFIHALTRVYAAAMAGRSQADGWEIYQRWITWVWQGEVTKVIADRVRDVLCFIDRQLRMRSSIPLFVPAGTPDNSPPFQRWGCGERGKAQPRQGRKTLGAGESHSTFQPGIFSRSFFRP